MGFIELVLRPLGQPRSTVAYPAQPADSVRSQRTPRFRPDRCDDSRQCLAACPTNAIVIEPGADGGRRWSLDYGACIFCGECIRVCPAGAIAGTGDYELAATARRSVAPTYILGGRAHG